MSLLLRIVQVFKAIQNLLSGEDFMRNKIIALFILGYNSSFAVVPTSDVYVMGQDTSTLTGYAAQVPAYLSQMSSTMNAANQVQNLHGLAQVQGAGQAVCSLCNANDLASMRNYVNQVNGDLCSQFSLALTNITGTQQAITNLQQIMTTFATNPKEAALALQQASVATQTATQNTLAELQMLHTQAQQKNLADEKIAQTQQSTMQDSMANGSW